MLDQERLASAQLHPAPPRRVARGQSARLLSGRGQQQARGAAGRSAWHLRNKNRDEARAATQIVSYTVMQCLLQYYDSQHRSTFLGQKQLFVFVFVPTKCLSVQLLFVVPGGVKSLSLLAVLRFLAENCVDGKTLLYIYALPTLIPC